MAKLNQIIAVCAGKKSHAASAITALYHTAQKEPLFCGLSKSYRPKDEEGERLPGESQKVQATVGGLIAEFRNTLSELWDVVATQEASNTTAKADIVVDGVTVLSGVPVTTLLFIEKQLTDVKTFVEKLPVLSASEDWTFNAESDCYATKMRETTRTKKVPRNHIKYEATKEHPAQVEMYTEDILVGYWQTTSFSGAIPATEKNGILARLRLLSDAVKAAREAANGAEATDTRIGRSLFDFVFGSESAV